jgi:osmotically-inducible protein OsmY
MADRERWRSEQDRYASREEERRGWRGEPGREEFGPRGRFEEGESFYSGSAGQSRGYQGYGGGGGDPRHGRFEEQREGLGSDWPSEREYRGGGGSGRREQGFGREHPGYRERSSYAASGPGADQGYGREQERGFWDRASDEVSSWFGDDEAERRRRMDDQRSGNHRGRGPRGYTRSDDRIREDVCDRLTDDPFIDASDIEIAVSKCEVTLSGTVESREARRRAEDLAERVAGVSHVQNNIRVSQHGSTAATAGSETGTEVGSGASRKTSRTTA